MLTEVVALSPSSAAAHLGLARSLVALGQADEAIAAGADVVMLDNFSGQGVKVASKSLKERWAGKKQFLLEVSGGLTEDNAESYICNGRLLFSFILFFFLFFFT